MLNGTGLKDKKVLVTGAGRGIGLGIARSFARAGAALWLHYRHRTPELSRLAEETASSGKAPRPRLFAADLGTPAGVEALFDAVDSEWGRLDAAVNNAGWDPGDVPWDRIDHDVYERLAGINIRGTLFCCLREMKLMRGTDADKDDGNVDANIDGNGGVAGGGSIINIGSVHMNSTVPGRTLYAASKGAIHAMTGSLALEGGPLGIRVNNIAPGYIAVERLSGAPGFDAQVIAGGIPLRRLGLPEDVAELAMFLASPESSFITGQSIVIDGGVERKLARASR